MLSTCVTDGALKGALGVGLGFCVLVGGTRENGGFSTTEYGSGKSSLERPWEECRGIGESFGYNRNENLEQYVSSEKLVHMLIDIVSRGGNLLLNIGPAADGTIPVIMQQRLIDIGDWLKINGEAIYETEAYKEPYQWSRGIRRTKKDASYMAGYSISKMIEPAGDTANIECFFTRKNKTLYCIIPSYRTSIVLKNISLPKGGLLHVLGSKANIPWKQTGKDINIDLSALRPGDLAEKNVFVVKLENAFQ